MIIVTGSLGFDYIMDFPGRFSDRIMPDKIHAISLSFLVDDLKKQWGGTAGNISYSLGLLGIKPLLLATAGNDFAPYKKYLEQHGVDTSQVKEFKNIATGSYFVITDKADNQIGAFYTGAMRHATKVSLKDCLFGKKGKKTVFFEDFVVIAANDPTAMRNYVDECIALNIPFMYDPAFQIDTFTGDDLKKAVTHAQILIGNDYEIELIAKKLGISKNKLLTMTPIVITTLGEKGATIECQVTNDKFQIFKIKPAKAKKVVDPTGAGDWFRSGFLAGYLRGLDLQTCGQMGALAAVYTVEAYGTTTHTFTKKEFIKRYRENYQMPLTIQ